MKLILCIKCSDVFSLRVTDRACSCGACGGRYLDDFNAEIWGDPSKYMILGFNNSSLVDACKKQLTEGDLLESMGGIYGDQPVGRRFEAFIIPEAARSVSRVITEH